MGEGLYGNNVYEQRPFFSDPSSSLLSDHSTLYLKVFPLFPLSSISSEHTCRESVSLKDLATAGGFKMTTRKRDETEAEDWFEVMGLQWDATGEDVSKGKYSIIHRGKNHVHTWTVIPSPQQPCSICHTINHMTITLIPTINTTLV